MGDPAAQRIWDAALGQLQIHVTRPNYDTWLKGTVGLRISDSQFVVGTPTEFVKEWLATRMRSLVSQTVDRITGRSLDVTFEIIGRNGDYSQGAPDPPPAADSAPQASISSPTPRPRLNPRYTFETFIVGESNRLAATAASAAAARPGQEYNPLFIYSAPGLGKTHLLQAILQRATADGRAALYVTSEQFTNDFITAIAQGRADDFRHRYRSLPLLLIDDIQFLASKERTQEEFFYTFNDLHSNGCQVVVASDRPPAAIQGLKGRLCSRFQWGLIADIQPPDMEMRLAILRAKALAQQVDLPLAVARLLADTVRANIRELEGSLNRVLAYAHLAGASAITPDIASRALAALTPTPTTLTDPQAIIKTVAAYFHLTPQALASSSRNRPIADARHITMYLLRHDAQLVLKEVGLLLGHRDHSTVIHSVHKVTQGLETNPRLCLQLAEIRALIRH